MGWNISIAVNCACALRATHEIGIFQIVNTWFHPHNVQMKGQLGVRRAKSTLSLLWDTRSCQTVVVTGIRALVSPGYVLCGSGAAGSTETWHLGICLQCWPSHQPADGMVMYRECAKPAAASLLLLTAFLSYEQRELRLLQRPGQNSLIEHLTSLTASGNTELHQQKDLQVRWHLHAVVRSCAQCLLHLDSRLVPKAEETNLNFLQLAYSWVPCVSKTCLIMWLPDVFFTSCTTSKNPTLTRFPNNEWKSPPLLLELSLHHWQQTVCRCWNNFLCYNVWRLASNVAELGTLKLNTKGRSKEKMLQEKFGTRLNQSYPSCGLWDVFCLPSTCIVSGP